METAEPHQIHRSIDAGPQKGKAKIKGRKKPAKDGKYKKQ